MRNTIFSVMFFNILFCFIPVINAENQDDQSLYTAENEIIEIRTIDPAPMVSPTKNERAMIAYNVGTTLMHQNRLNEAEIYLLEAVELDPVFVDAIDHLAIVYRRQNRFEEAEIMYLKSIRINNTNTVPFINLAVIYMIQNKLNDAFLLYRHVVQIQPNNPEGYFGIGSIFFIIGNYESAMAFINTSIELYKELNSSLIYNAFYYKGMIYFRTGEYDEALFYLEEAVKGNPNNAVLVERAVNEIKKLK